MNVFDPSDPYVTFDPKLVIPQVPLRSMILLTKFHQNRSRHVRARAILVAEEEEEEELELPCVHRTRLTQPFFFMPYCFDRK